MSGVGIELLGPNRPVPGPPSDSTVRLRAQDWDGTEFVRRCSISLTGLGTFTAFTLFWNGFVGAILMSNYKFFAWHDFLFFSPFVAVGLMSLAGWVMALLTPFMVQRWVIGPREASARFSCLGLGWTRRFDATEIIRVEVRWDSPSPDKEDDTPCTLSLVGVDGREWIALRDLTDGEARWIGGMACEMLRGSLPKPSFAKGPANLMGAG